jgi:hypothetical protein
MKVQTDTTKVFSSVQRTGTGGTATVTTTTIPDLIFTQQMSDPAGSGAVANPWWYDRLRGGIPGESLNSSASTAAGANSSMLTRINMNTYTLGSDAANSGINIGGNPYINWNFTRAPQFFDEVCYFGTGSNTTQAHNLGKVPEMMIVKNRSNSALWAVYATGTGNTKFIQLNSQNAPVTDSTVWNNTTPTSTQFSIGTAVQVNTSAQTYVAYLFATCPNVSKVGSYTGTGTLTTINCNFTAGAKWLMIRRTDTTGPWAWWDTTRGMVAGTDPYLRMNTTADQQNGNSVYTIATGFQLLASPAVDVNTSGGTYIFLAIA